MFFQTLFVVALSPHIIQFRGQSPTNDGYNSMEIKFMFARCVRVESQIYFSKLWEELLEFERPSEHSIDGYTIEDVREILQEISKKTVREGERIHQHGMIQYFQCLQASLLQFYMLEREKQERKQNKIPSQKE